MLYMEKNVIQRVISEEACDVMLICKENNENIVNELQKYIKDVYDNFSYLSYPQLYSYLIKITIELCNSDQINSILTGDIPRYYDFKLIKNNLNMKNTKLDYEDLCQILINKLMLLQVRENVDGEYIDLFLVDMSGKLESLSDYINISKSRCKK